MALMKGFKESWFEELVKLVVILRRCLEMGFSSQIVNH